MKKTILALAFLLFAGVASAQKISFDPENGAIGFGAMLLGDEATTFSWKSSFAAIKWHGIGIASRTVTTGIGFEIHPAAVLTFIEDGGTVNQIEEVDARLWSLNRVEASVMQIPGDIWESMYLGTDLLIKEFGSTDWSGDFTARFVYGVEDDLGPGKLQLEFYMFEKYRPISFCVFYHF